MALTKPFSLPFYAMALTILFSSPSDAMATLTSTSTIDVTRLEPLAMTTQFSFPSNSDCTIRDLLKARRNDPVQQFESGPADFYYVYSDPEDARFTSCLPNRMDSVQYNASGYRQAGRENYSCLLR